MLNTVLIIKLWALGDILMATPMLTALKNRYPGVRVTWIVDSVHGDLLQNHPLIDDLVVLDTGGWRRLLRKGNIWAWLSRTADLRRQMQARQFDAVINCHPDKWWTLALCAAPIRVGLYPSVRSSVSRHFYTDALPLPQSPSCHNTDHYLIATSALGCADSDKKMTLGQIPDESNVVQAFRQAHEIRSEELMIVLAPFSTAENRQWELERLAQVADWLRTAYEAQIVLPCGPGDVARAREIAALTRQTHIHLAESTTLRQYIGLLRSADLVICGDSSPMHIAAAVGTPYVALFGPTPLRERAPLVGRGLPLAKSLFCAPCDQSTCRNPIFRECMKLITVADVQEAVTSLLKETHEPSPLV